jgi:hypothetical protein
VHFEGEKPTYNRFHQPESRLPAKHLEWIAHKEDHDDRKHQRVDERRNRETRREEKAENRDAPDDAKDRGQLHQMLLGEMISRIQLKDQHVIASSRSPAINVDSNEKHKHDDEQRGAVEAKSHF